LNIAQVDGTGGSKGGKQQDSSSEHLSPSQESLEKGKVRVKIGSS